METHVVQGQVSRAEGCLLGQLCGDALGSQVEFQSAEDIAREHPGGVRALEASPVWRTLAGQPTDDSELALALARSLVAAGRFERAQVRQAYVAWLDSGPFDCGDTTRRGLGGTPNHDSQANGALMRISPLGIFGVHQPPEALDDAAREEARLTHPHPVCVEANALFARALAAAIREGLQSRALYAQVCAWVQAPNVPGALRDVTLAAAAQPPPDFQKHQGWVLVAWHNAWWQLLHQPSAEEALVDTVGRGGDTDTNAAIAGALLGAVHGSRAWPSRWVDTVLACRPRLGAPGVRRPRPETYWPTDALALARALLEAGATVLPRGGR